MTDSELEREAQLREVAQSQAGNVIPGSGVRGQPRRMAQMISLRLDGDLIGALRGVAEREGVSMSELLRRAAEAYVDDYERELVPLVRVTHLEGASFRVSDKISRTVRDAATH